MKILEKMKIFLKNENFGKKMKILENNENFGKMEV